MNERLLHIVTLMLLCLFSQWAQAADKLIQGHVVNAIDKSTVKEATIHVNSRGHMTKTDDLGLFALECKQGDTINVEANGYESLQRVITGKEPALLSFALMPINVDLNEVVVKAGKYSKKDNPAVELAKKLIKRRDEGKLEDLDFYQRTSSRRVAYGLNNFQAQRDNHILNRYTFLADYADTVTIDQVERPVLPISVTHTVTNESFSMAAGHRDTVLTSTHAGLDESFDQDGIQAFLSKMICEVDIFQNDIPFMNNRFVSPLSTIGTTYYKYFLGDSIVVDGDSCVILEFTPFTPQAMGFNGRLYVTTDTTLFIKRVELSLPKSINLNFIGDMAVTQTYQLLHGARAPISKELIVEFVVFKNAQSLYAQQSTIYNDYHFTTGPSFTSSDNDIIDRLHGVDDISQMLGKLRSNKRFFWSEFAIKAFAQGYFPTAKKASESYFDFGPIGSLFSSNKLEGFRTRLGGRTTTKLSSRFFLDGYLAMGWKDHKLKYRARAVYSFTPKKQFVEEYPISSITLQHHYDTHLLGHDFLYSQADNILFSFSRAPDDKRLYRRITMLTFKQEVKRGLIFSLSLSHNMFEPTVYVPFVDGQGNVFKNYKAWEITFGLRFSPGEKFLVNYHGRSPVTEDAPIFTLTHTFTPSSSALGTRLSNRTEIGMQKRFWLSAAGYVDMIVKASKQWNKVHYFDLLLPNANLTYSLQPESYALLNLMEFINDQQLTWDITYWLNGAIMNRIPIFKKLKLREVISFRGLWGSLKKDNNPNSNPELFQLPPEVVYQSMGKKPYMEMGVGIDNILKLFHIDYVWRLTYRDTPGTDRHGIRFSLHFSF